ncbi:MAG: DciA family protein [Bifidobacteriaceae bacterium]|jgi:predicted nucleic acid-binding Zn ribbon protein|nr:DciA family protein [Bifidobacteriaceae bacterium]
MTPPAAKDNRALGDEEVGRTAEKAVLARIMRGSTRFKPRPAAKWSNGRDPKMAGELVNELLAAEGWQGQVAEGAVIANWQQIVGPRVAEHCQIVSLEEGKLIIKADSSTWATEIRLLSPQLQGAIDRAVGPGVVNAVEVLGPEARRQPARYRRPLPRR